jgi:hypothetical protein
MPNLNAEVAFWLHVLQCDGWVVDARHADDLRDPRTGAAIWGICYPQADSRTARIEIATPNTPESRREWEETVVHEVLHCALAALDAPLVLEEQFVWPLARFLAWMRRNMRDALEGFAASLPWGSPAGLKAVARSAATASGRVFLAARARERVGGQGMDAVAILVALCKGLLEMGNLPEEAKTLAQTTLASVEQAPTSGEGPEEAPTSGEAPTKEEPAGSPKPPTMGVSENDPAYRKLREQLDADRAAAVDGMLDQRPDLTPKQRGWLREVGVKEGVSRLRAGLLDLLPPVPKPQKQRPEPKARLGLDTVPRGGANASGRGFRPSGNKQSMRRLRVVAEETDEISAPGCRLHTEEEREESGKLMEMSIWEALSAIKKAVDQSVSQRRRRMGGEA